MVAIALDSSRLLAQTPTSLLMLESNKGAFDASWTRVWTDPTAASKASSVSNDSNTVTLCNVLLESHAVTLQTDPAAGAVTTLDFWMGSEVRPAEEDGEETQASSWGSWVLGPVWAACQVVRRWWG